MKLTKEQKDALAISLGSPYGMERLICDGFRIDLVVERTGRAMSYRVMTYINGSFKGLWMSPNNEFPEQKFLRKSSRPLYSAAKIAAAKKRLGVRNYAKYCKDMDKKITVFMPDWASGHAAISHLCKVCDSVEIAPAEVAE